MLLTYSELVQLVSDGVLLPVKQGDINASSIEVHLSNKFMLEREVPNGTCIDLSVGEVPEFDTVALEEHPNASVVLAPGAFVLASTIERFDMPANTSALFVMKSRLARAGLDQMNATWCLPGWSGTLTLELMNVTRFHSLKLRPGMPIGQIVFFRGAPAPKEALYSSRGRFHNVFDTVSHGKHSVRA